MTIEERNQKLEELSNAISELEAFLAQNGITIEDDDYDDDVTCEKLDGDDLWMAVLIDGCSD
jgi:hypothetical protein